MPHYSLDSQCDSIEKVPQLVGAYHSPPVEGWQVHPDEVVASYLLKNTPCRRGRIEPPIDLLVQLTVSLVL